MDPAVKTAMTACVLAVGVCAAMLFRRDPSRASPPDLAEVEQLVIRARARERAADTVCARQAEGHDGKPTAPARRPPTVLMPTDRQSVPPSLARDYPEAARPADSRWGTSMDMMLPDGAVRTHKVVDGDTLPALAARYLGSAKRAGEIYESNRDVLSDPRLLPIGVELKIPKR
jgi:nucleoid-associated protein YgaU